MKIWQSYGSEHSMDLVMIGHFKDSKDAIETNDVINQLTNGLNGKIDVGKSSNRFSDEILDLLRKTECHCLSPHELEQFLYEASIRIEENKIILETDEADVSAFFKLMILNGAKVEVFSKHDRSETQKEGKK